MPNSTVVAVRILVALVAVCLCAALSAEEFSSLEERMTASEFRQAGLDKLSAEELAALNRWIRQRSLAEGEALERRQSIAGGPGGDRRGFSDGERTPIISRIDGPFSGWDGESEFKLQNGMVWRQAESGSHVVAEMENPRVEIRPGTFGTWQLIVADHNRRLKVERVE